VVGRPERDLPGEGSPLTEFARRLRAIRAVAGQPSYRRLAAITHYSSATLARAAGGYVLPSLDVTLAYVAGCGGDPQEWREAWKEVATWLDAQVGPAADQSAAEAVGAQPGDGLADDDLVGGPAQLPPDTADFTGRVEQVDLLCGLLGAEPAQDRPGAVVISAISGMGGVGKTALAVHVAHRLRDRFPDGQLFVSLQGATRPLRPAEVLARFLRDLGVPDTAIPAGEAERAARFRTLLAGRRMLILLDDARDVSQVRPLLPGTAGCAVIVTSRSALPGLPGSTLLDLEVLDQDAAQALFCAIGGPDRAAAEPAATASLLASCDGLPLAIRIAASRLASRPGWSIAHLADRLADESARLAELTAGDLAVRATFAVSYDTLPEAGDPAEPDPAQAFRLLGLASGRVLSLPAIAALAGRPVDAMATALEILTDAHLVESPAPDRYRLHDLLRSYAADLAQHTETTQQRTAAIDRLLRWFAEQAVAAWAALAPASRLPVIMTLSGEQEVIAAPEQALDWYESELTNLVTAVRQAADLGLHDVAAQIAAAMWGFFRRTPYLEDWIAVSQIGVDSARRLGHEGALHSLLNGLGQAHGRQGDFAASHRCLTEALEIRRRLGDRSGQAATLNSLACDLFYQERFEEALAYLWPALEIHASLGEQPQLGVVLNNIGHALLGLKRPGEALDYLGRSLVIRRETDNRYGVGITESTLGDACRELGRFEEAVGHYQRARAALQETARDHAD
jgi:tetratricopeptide (TPR) repeat protein